MQDTISLFEAARNYRQIGLNAIPCRADKRPVGAWSEYHNRFLHEDEFKAKLSDAAGIGIICGKSSGNLEVIDIDQKYSLSKTLNEDFLDRVNQERPDLIDKLYIVQTRSGGLHLYYRCQTIEGNQKLASRYCTEEELKKNAHEKVKVLIETRGQGGFVVAPPTEGYAVWLENPIPEITIDEREYLLETARSFNEVFEERPYSLPKTYTADSPYEVTPWEDYNQRGDTVGLLEKHGWTIHHKSNDRTYLTRPGKTEGYSGDYHAGILRFTSFSTSQSDFKPQWAYDPTGVYASLEHSGDISAAVKALEAQGYGKRKPKPEPQPDNAWRTDSSPPDLPNSSVKEPDKVNYYEKFLQSVLAQDKEYSLPVPIVSLSQNDTEIPLLTLMSFSLWQGKQKSKKTTALALMVAAYLKGGDGIFVAGVKGTVIWFDNEQGQSYAARTMKLILKLAGLQQCPCFIYCDLRELSPKERKKVIAAAIENTPDVKLVVVDGVVDLLTDFMDAEEGHMTVTDILKLCSQFDSHIAGVLHQNKGDKNARAHIGTISSQKCEMEISTEVDPDDRNQSFVECVNSRGLPFEKFAIRWDKGSLPKVNDEWSAIAQTDRKTSINHEHQKKVAEAIFRPFAALSHTEAIKGIQEATLKGESTAKTYLKNYLGWGFISKGEDGKYRINVDGGSRVNEGQNRVN